MSAIAEIEGAKERLAEIYEDALVSNELRSAATSAMSALKRYEKLGHASEFVAEGMREAIMRLWILSDRTSTDLSRIDAASTMVCAALCDLTNGEEEK